MDEFIRIRAITPKVYVGNVRKNEQSIVRLCNESNAAITVFPELCVTGYTCGDLFANKEMISSAELGVRRIANLTTGKGLLFIGCPIVVGGSLYNCAVVINRCSSEILGIIPKQYLPNYKEFYERRWFTPADEPKTYGPNSTIFFGGANVPFGTDILFGIDTDILVGVEICEDLWVPIPPSSFQALAGANILINLSASNETVGKADYRRDLVVNQSARCMASYVYCSAGVHESTSDLVFGGHSLIAENGSLLVESQRFERDDHFIESDVNLLKIYNERIKTSSFADSKRLIQSPYRIIYSSKHSVMEIQEEVIYPKVENPFVPSRNSRNWDLRCSDIFDIQVAGLAKRIESANVQNMYIGISGGLDSTLAVLVAWEACVRTGRDTNMIHGITMPGFGTSNRTKDNATKLMDVLNISKETIDIKQLTFDTFKSIQHSPFGISLLNETLESFNEKLKLVENPYDPVFENTQARVRTLILMNKGFVLGTGDMSELALGWATYNGDHMSMYNVNCSIPKTLVKELVRWVAQVQEAWIHNGGQDILLDIIDTEVSPELLPANGDKIQSTEDTLGPYQLHDLFLFYFVRHGYDIRTIYETVCRDTTYEPSFVKTCLETFIKRFFANQFKRNCVPDGPKVGSVSLSPRGDWRMPSDADMNMYLEAVKGL